MSHESFNFDGLLVELIDSSSKSDDKKSEIICSICLHTTEDAVILKACYDTFCRPCLVKTIIESESDVIKCPTKYSKCDKELELNEVREILGEENFGILMAQKLEAKLDSLSFQDNYSRSFSDLE